MRSRGSPCGVVVGGAGRCGLGEAAISAGVVSMSVGELLRVWLLSVGGLGHGVAGVGGGGLVGSVGSIQLVWGGVEKSGLGGDG